MKINWHYIFDSYISITADPFKIAIDHQGQMIQHLTQWNYHRGFTIKLLTDEIDVGSYTDANKYSKSFICLPHAIKLRNFIFIFYNFNCNWNTSAMMIKRNTPACTHNGSTHCSIIWWN